MHNVIEPGGKCGVIDGGMGDATRWGFRLAGGPGGGCFPVVEGEAAKIAVADDDRADRCWERADGGRSSASCFLRYIP